MRNKLRRFWALIIIFLLALYAAVLLRGLTESTRRSLQLTDQTDAADRVFISILVTNASPAAQELTAQLGFRVVGSLAKDDVTPAVDLKLLVNNFRGQQEFDFPKGKRMNRIEITFPLNGDLNKYPLDRYHTTMWFLMTTPTRNMQPQPSKAPGSAPEITHHTDELAVSSIELQRNAPVSLSASISASIPGVRFRGNVSRGNTQEPTAIDLDLTRANSVIAVSLIVNLMMTALSISLLAMVLRATTQGAKTDLLPLSVSISLIFGLPALRNIQPAVPPVGAFVDYVTFIWAELIVAASAIIIVWTWLLRSRPESHAKS
jgi:Domain of unknown function (DUF4436)